jgi:uncharacterized membrane protein (DUF485 family)
MNWNHQIKNFIGMSGLCTLLLFILTISYDKLPIIDSLYNSIVSGITFTLITFIIAYIITEIDIWRWRKNNEKMS